MSKIQSELVIPLQDQANKLGFSSLQEAFDNGYHVTYSGNKVCLAYDMDKAHKEAHEAWLKEKEGVLNELYNLSTTLEMTTHLSTEPVKKAIKFIEGVKYEQ